MEIKFSTMARNIKAGRVLHIAYIDIIIAALHQGTQQQILIIENWRTSSLSW